MEALLILALIFAVAGYHTLAMWCVSPVFLFFAFFIIHSIFTFFAKLLVRK